MVLRYAVCDCDMLCAFFVVLFQPIFLFVSLPMLCPRRVSRLAMLPFMPQMNLLFALNQYRTMLPLLSGLSSITLPYRPRLSAEPVLARCVLCAEKDVLNFGDQSRWTRKFGKVRNSCGPAAPWWPSLLSTSFASSFHERLRFFFSVRRTSTAVQILSRIPSDNLLEDWYTSKRHTSTPLILLGYSRGWATGYDTKISPCIFVSRTSRHHASDLRFLMGATTDDNDCSSWSSPRRFQVPVAC